MTVEDESTEPVAEGAAAPEETAEETAEEQTFEDAFAEFSGEEAEYEEVEDSSGGEEAQAADEEDDSDADGLAAEGEHDAGDETPESNEGDATDQAIQQEIARAQAEIERLRHQLTSETGRTSALQKKINELEQMREQRNDPDNIEFDEEAIKLLKEDYPEVATAIDAVVNQKVAEINKAVNARIHEALQPLQQQQFEQIERIQREALQKSHPDFEQLSQSEEYWNWVDSQPDAIRQMAESEFANDVSYVLNIYKGLNGSQGGPAAGAGADGGADDAQTRRKQDKRARQLKDMQGLPSRSAGKPAVLEKDDFENAFAHFSHQKEAEMSRR